MSVIFPMLLAPFLFVVSVPLGASAAAAPRRAALLAQLAIVHRAAAELPLPLMDAALRCPSPPLHTLHKFIYIYKIKRRRGPIILRLPPANCVKKKLCRDEKLSIIPWTLSEYELS